MDNQARPSTKRVCADDALQKLANASAAKMPKRKAPDGPLPVDDALLTQVLFAARSQLAPRLSVNPKSTTRFATPPSLGFRHFFPLRAMGWTLRERVETARVQIVEAAEGERLREVKRVRREGKKTEKVRLASPPPPPARTRPSVT